MPLTRRKLTIGGGALIVSLGASTSSQANPLLAGAYILYLVYRLGRITLAIARTVLVSPITRTTYAVVVRGAKNAVEVAKASYNSRALAEILKVKEVYGLALVAGGLVTEYVLNEGDSTAPTGDNFRSPIYLETGRKAFKGGKVRFVLTKEGDPSFREERSVFIPRLPRKSQKDFGELFFSKVLEDGTYLLEATGYDEKGKKGKSVSGRLHAVSEELKEEIDSLL